MSKSFLTATALAALLVSAACASREPEALPPPASPPPPPPAAPAPAPAPTPAPPAPVERAPAPSIAPGTIQDFSVNIGDRIYFDLDQHTLRADARAVLQRQAAWLGAYPAVTILVAGNCDERGTREYNLALGARRAESVRDYLVSLGVEPNRIETVSNGKERPIDARSNEEAWALNRNAHTQIVAGATS